ncbi:MAG: 4-demethylwyosine synthase TYW1 [Candidatus Iainarchaeum sp.]
MKKIKKIDLVKDFSHKKYGFFKDASIQVCEWNKKALRGEGVCYKQDFYGAHTLSCHQITPVTFWCNNSCVFCWRPNEYMGPTPDSSAQNTNPSELIEGLISARKKLLTGFKGHSSVSKNIFDSSQECRHWAISLSGEPTLYKNLPKLIKELKKRKGVETIFLVSNGQNPSMLKRLKKEGALPTQLYISMVGPNERVYKSITCNFQKRGWVNYLESLALLPLLGTRTVIRLTLIKGVNDKSELVSEFASVLSATGSDFIEIKSYMWLGFSRDRLGKNNMPTFKEVKQFVSKLLELLPDYKFENEKENSRIVLLKRKDSKYKTKIIDRD